MTFEMTRIKQRLADVEKNQKKLLKLIFEANSTMAALQIQINMITEKNTGKDHPLISTSTPPIVLTPKGHHYYNKMESLNNTTPHITSVDIDEQVYRSDPAIAASDLKYAKDHGLQAFHTYKYGKNNPPRIATPAMKFGSMCHKFCLEPKLFSVSYSLLDDKRTKAGKATALALQEKGIETFTTSEMDTLVGIYTALRNNEFANKYIIQDTLKNTRGLAEQSYWWKHRETGLQCKCRCDYVIDDMVIDLKTTGEGGASQEAFTRTIVNFSYFLQSSHYLQGTGQKRFIFVAVEKVFPYSVGVYELSPDFIERGYELQEQILSDIKQAQESGIWAGYTDQAPEGIKTLTPPKWL